jgi:demethoxyubiquinone hydroxylase (CLK1/Coq7/Cat5 family)
LRVVSKLGAARRVKHADDFLLVDCADPGARLFQFVEQAACISICHIWAQQSFYRKRRKGRKVNREIGSSENKTLTTEARRHGKKSRRFGLVLRFLHAAEFPITAITRGDRQSLRSHKR